MTPPRPQTVLVAEADASLREPLVRALEDDGYRVVAAASGDDAIDILWRHRERIDWLFTAVRLPGAVDGWRVAEEFRFSHPLRPVVYATAQVPEAGRAVPRSLYFPTPYRALEVAAALRGLSAGRGEPAPAPAGGLDRKRGLFQEPNPDACG
jgi:two-component system, OmpR family, response regulator